MNYAVLTDDSSAAQTMMKGFVGTVQIKAFTAHIFWLMENTNETDVETMQNSSHTYASVMLPTPL